METVVKVGRSVSGFFYRGCRRVLAAIPLLGLYPEDDESNENNATVWDVEGKKRKSFFFFLLKITWCIVSFDFFKMHPVFVWRGSWFFLEKKIIISWGVNALLSARRWMPVISGLKLSPSGFCEQFFDLKIFFFLLKLN